MSLSSRPAVRSSRNETRDEDSPNLPSAALRTRSESNRRDASNRPRDRSSHTRSRRHCVFVAVARRWSGRCLPTSGGWVTPLRAECFWAESLTALSPLPRCSAGGLMLHRRSRSPIPRQGTARRKSATPAESNVLDSAARVNLKRWFFIAYHWVAGEDRQRPERLVRIETRIGPTREKATRRSVGVPFRPPRTRSVHERPERPRARVGKAPQVLTARPPDWPAKADCVVARDEASQRAEQGAARLGQPPQDSSGVGRDAACGAARCLHRHTERAVGCRSSRTIDRVGVGHVGRNRGGGGRSPSVRGRCSLLGGPRAKNASGNQRKLLQELPCSRVANEPSCPRSGPRPARPKPPRPERRTP